MLKAMRNIHVIGKTDTKMENFNFEDQCKTFIVWTWFTGTMNYFSKCAQYTSLYSKY